MNSHSYNLTWIVVLTALLLTGCAMWSIPVEQTTVEFDLTAMVLMAIGGVSLAVWLLTEPRAVLEAAFLPVLAWLELRRIRCSPFWRHGRCSPEEFRRHFLPLLRYCSATHVRWAEIDLHSISLPNALSPG